MTGTLFAIKEMQLIHTANPTDPFSMSSSITVRSGSRFCMAEENDCNTLIPQWNVRQGNSAPPTKLFTQSYCLGNSVESVEIWSLAISTDNAFIVSNAIERVFFCGTSIPNDLP